MKAAGVLTRLSLAWSRDDKDKFYVQDRMREVGSDIWTWLDGRRALLRLRRGRAWARTWSAPWSTSSPNTARRPPTRRSPIVADLKKRGRYQADIY